MQRPARPAHRPRTVSRCPLPACFILAALLICLIAAAAAPAAPGDVVWRDFAQRVEGGDDAYRALAVTSAGDAYAAGSTAATADAPADVLVRKFGSGGSVLWKRIWTHPGRTDDEAADVVRDRRGSLVVAGSSGNSWLLLKYSSQGYLQWVRRGRASFARCAFTAVTVDGAGNVYAAGVATPAGGDQRFLAVKYSSSGSLRWRRSFASPDGDALGTCIVCGGGDAYVAGRFARGPAGGEVATVRYSAGGARRWVRYHAAGDDATAASIGYSSGPLVAGSGAVAGGLPKGFVVRYSADGTRQWAASYQADGVTGDRFDDLDVDAHGGACVTGTRWAGDTQAMITVRFSPLGVLEWAEILGTAERGFALCRAAGEGYYSAGGASAVTVGRTSGTGAPVWEQSIAPAGYGDFRPVAVQAGGDAYVYAAGWASRATGGTSAMLIRYLP